MALPTLTPEQRQEALKKAAAARTARKELRDAIARGDETIPAVLGRAKTDAVVGKTKVADLLSQTLDEEAEADEKLTTIAESSINVEAEVGDEE